MSPFLVSREASLLAILAMFPPGGEGTVAHQQVHSKGQGGGVNVCWQRHLAEVIHFVFYGSNPKLS